MKRAWRCACRVYGSPMDNNQALSGTARGRLPIAPQGWPFIIAVAACWLLVSVLCWTVASVVLFLLLVFVVNFFRDPTRDTPQGDGLFICPADGRVIRAEVKDDHLRVDIFMNVFNVHVNRAPMDGVITDLTYTRGKFVNASFDEASEENERHRFELRTEAGVYMHFTQISGLLARRIISYVQPGDMVKAGQRIGMIRFGSRVDCEVPIDFSLNVQVGDHVTAGSTILATRSNTTNHD